jgi:sulfonate transport system permease protein
LILGFTIGTLIGLVLGVMVGTSKFAERLFAPTIQFLAPIPPIAWIPLLIILIGIGEASKIGLIIIASFVVVYLNTVQGIRSTDQKLVDVAHVLRKSNKELIKKVLLPSATPHIFTGMRIALGLSWILLIAAEVIASSKGLGWLIWDSRNFSRPDDLFVGIIMIGILGKLSDMVLVAFEKQLTHWRTVFQGK